MNQVLDISERRAMMLPQEVRNYDLSAGMLLQNTAGLVAYSKQLGATDAMRYHLADLGQIVSGATTAPAPQPPAINLSAQPQPVIAAPAKPKGQSPMPS